MKKMYHDDRFQPGNLIYLVDSRPVAERSCTILVLDVNHDNGKILLWYHTINHARKNEPSNSARIITMTGSRLRLALNEFWQVERVFVS